MAQLTKKRAGNPKPYVLSDFSGIDVGGIDGGFTSLVNFRIDRGHLKKRCGSRLLERYSADIRGLWYGDFDGRPTLFCAAGNKLYQGIGSERTMLAQLETSSGQVCMFFFHGCLYLIDGSEFYCWDGESLNVIEGYVVSSFYKPQISAFLFPLFRL